MTDANYLGLKQFITNVEVNDDKFLYLIDKTIKDIARETKLFKRLYSFSTFKDIEIYDLQFIANINERTQKNVIDLTINEPTEEELLTFIQTGTSFSDYIDFTLTTDEPSGYISLLEVTILNEDLSISPDFLELEQLGFKYKFLLNEPKQYLFEAVVLPTRNSISSRVFDIIQPSLVEGLKYYILDDISNAPDAQVANLYYTRYFNEKRKLIDLFPVNKRVIIKRNNGFTNL